MKLQHHTIRYMSAAFLVVIAVWAALFYAYITEEVYDNIDDGLRNSQLRIIRESYINPEILNTNEYGLNQFKITPLPTGKYKLKTTFETTTMFMEYDNDDEPIRKLTCVFNHEKDGKSYRLEIVTSMIEEDELLENMLEALLILYIMLVVSILVLNHFILKKVWKSFINMLQQLRDYSIGQNKSFDIPKNNIDEFNQLGSALLQMVSRNEKTFNSQKQFIENASHELQTPLAIAQNKIELLSEDETMSEDQLKQVSEIGESINRMIRFNKSLLTISRVENQQFNATEPINFTNLTQEIIDNFSDIIEYSDITVNLAFIEPFVFEMNPDLANVLITNLLKNAIIHNSPKGEIQITTTRNKLTFWNTSDSGALDSDKIFSRFYRSTTNKQSTGLGLSIVKSITDTYSNIDIQYSYNNGHQFEVNIK